MQGLRYRLIRLMLEAIAGLGLDRALGPFARRRGVVLTFHHVRPDALASLPENAGLSITPDFLEQVILLLRRLNYDIVTLGDVPTRLAGEGGRPFAALTFDDGYRDNAEFALPILRRHNAPMTLFVCPGFAERMAPLWWLDLEEAVMRLDRFAIDLPDGGFSAESPTREAKIAALRALYWRLRQQDEPSLRIAVATLARQAGLDPAARIDRLCMDWDELRRFADDPLVTIGAHTLTHPRLAKLDEDAARMEIAGSRERILSEIGVDARDFAYPVGDPTSAGEREFALAREAGFRCAVTTRPGVLKGGVDLLALPRISVNGLYQQPRYLRALVSGVPFLMKR